MGAPVPFWQPGRDRTRAPGRECTSAVGLLLLLTMAKTKCANKVADFIAPFMNKNSSGDEIANVNFYAVHPEARKLPKFAEMTQNNGHYAVQSQ